jgi:hypothetical protein
MPCSFPFSFLRLVLPPFTSFPRFSIRDGFSFFPTYCCKGYWHEAIRLQAGIKMDTCLGIYMA